MNTPPKEKPSFHIIIILNNFSNFFKKISIFLKKFLFYEIYKIFINFIIFIKYIKFINIK